MRNLPVPLNATHFRIVSDRVLHRAFTGVGMATVAVLNNVAYAPTSNVAKFINVACPVRRFVKFSSLSLSLSLVFCVDVCVCVCVEIDIAGRESSSNFILKARGRKRVRNAKK